MARRKKEEGETVSLFPFLSILACVIGVLTLMITAMALSGMDSPEGARAERADVYEQSSEQLVRDRAALETLKQVTRISDDIFKASQELDRLEQQKKKSEDDEKLKIELLAKLARLREANDALKNDPDATARAAELKTLQAELKRRRTPPEEAQVLVQPGGSGTNIVPTFVECTKTGAVLHAGGEPQLIARGALSTNENFLALLDRVSKTDNGTVVFLLRDDAVSTYFTARDVARIRQCRNGKLPLLGHGRVDLSQFNELNKQNQR